MKVGSSLHPEGEHTLKLDSVPESLRGERFNIAEVYRLFQAQSEYMYVAHRSF